MGKKYKRCHDRITGKLIVECTIENTSPMLMSSGKTENSDRDCIRWVDGSPYLPSSSLTGVIRGWYDRFFPDDKSEFFWGSRDTSAAGSVQSHFVIDDCRLIEGSGKDRFLIRDGVRIDHELGVAMETGKYDYELLAPGHQFRIRMEVTARKGNSKRKRKLSELKSIAMKVLSIMNHELFAVGALSTTGFGKVVIREMKMRSFDFQNVKEDREAWFAYLENPRIETEIDKASLPSIAFSYCKMDARFTIKSALITGAYPVDEASPDKIQLQTNGKNVLSGKAIKGSLRHRSTRILNTIEHPNVDRAIANIFGDVDEKKKSAIKSRLIVNETTIDKGVKPMIQDRIKIDRWTGGVVGGAKFDSEPLWSVSENEDDHFLMTMILLQPKKVEIALLLHLVKDLWNSDLPIGGEKNVGRGVLVGHTCDIRLSEGEQARILKKGDNISIHNKDILEPYNDCNLKSLKATH